MKLDSIVRFALIASCASGLFALDTAELAKRSDKGFKPVVVKDWKAPDESTIPNNLFGDTVRYGKALVNETYKYIGPEGLILKCVMRETILPVHPVTKKQGLKNGLVLLWQRFLTFHNTATVMKPSEALKGVSMVVWNAV